MIFYLEWNVDEEIKQFVGYAWFYSPVDSIVSHAIHEDCFILSCEILNGHIFLISIPEDKFRREPDKQNFARRLLLMIRFLDRFTQLCRYLDEIKDKVGKLHKEINIKFQNDRYIVRATSIVDTGFDSKSEPGNFEIPVSHEWLFEITTIDDMEILRCEIDEECWRILRYLYKRWTGRSLRRPKDGPFFV